MRRAVLALFLTLIVTVCFAQKGAKQAYNTAMEYVKAGNPVKAIEFFSIAMSMEPEDDVPVFGRACAKMSMGDIEGAIVDFSHTLELNPYSYQSYHNLGVMEYEAENFKTAETYFRYSVELDPTNVNGLFSLAKLSYAKENIEDTIEYFDRALKVNKTLKLLSLEQLLYCYIHRASSYSIKGEFSKALADINKALELDATDYYTHYIKGSILFELRAFNQAIRSYSTALEANSEFGYGYFVRAMAKRDAGDKKGAEDDFAIAKKHGYVPK